MFKRKGPNIWDIRPTTRSYFVVELGPSSSAHHLQDVGDGEIDVSLRFAIVVFRPFNDDQMSGEVHSPGEGWGGDQHLNAVIELRECGSFVERSRRRVAECGDRFTTRPILSCMNGNRHSQQ